MKARSKPVSTVSFVPPMINTGLRHRQDPRDGGAGDREVAGQGRGARRDGCERQAEEEGCARSRTTVGGSIGSYSEGYAANAANDLSSAC